jgi:pteridine reductase
MILAGATAVVTGGAVRIGREIGRHLAQAGVNVCVHCNSSTADAEEAVEEFQAFGVQATSISANLSSPRIAAKEIFDHANQVLGKVSILVNSAAIFETGNLTSTSEKDWDRHFDINLKAPFFLTQSFADQLGDQHGHVINIVDWRGEKPVTGHAAYTISKAGLVAQTKLLAQELGPRIKVNGIAPGAILATSGESENDFQSRAKLNPLQRTGFAADIAKAGIYLLESEFVTGEILNVTGGQQLS